MVTGVDVALAVGDPVETLGWALGWMLGEALSEGLADGLALSDEPSPVEGLAPPGELVLADGELVELDGVGVGVYPVRSEQAVPCAVKAAAAVVWRSVSTFWAAWTSARSLVGSVDGPEGLADGLIDGLALPPEELPDDPDEPDDPAEPDDRPFDEPLPDEPLPDEAWPDGALPDEVLADEALADEALGLAELADALADASAASWASARS